jgi:hypothetical protein
VARLFKRAWKVKVDTLQFSELDISFEVEKTGRREPNKCSLKIWNLTRDHRRQLEALTVRRGQGQIRVELEAGYQNQLGLIFRGDLRRASSHREGPDVITEVEGEDGGRAVLWGRVNRSFPAGTPVETVLRACAEAMGVGMGNLAEASAGARLEGGGNTFAEGTVLSGPAAEELDHLLRSMGLRYSVQNGVLQILQRGQALQTTAVRLSPTTGLVDSPEVNADGTVSATCLLNPDIYPGRQVQFDSVDLAGTYRVEKAKYQGDSFGGEWYIHMECQPLSRRT